jgi:hypothetical protein
MERGYTQCRYGQDGPVTEEQRPKPLMERTYIAMSLTPKKVIRLKQSLNSTAQKVYAATPIAEPWDLHKIVGELERVGVCASLQGIHGSLKHLTELGLVKEVSKNSYQQYPIVRPTDEPIKEEETAMVNPVTTLTVPKKSPEVSQFDRLQLRLTGLQKIAADLQQEIVAISDELLTLQVGQEEEGKKYQKIAELLDAIGSLKK